MYLINVVVLDFLNPDTVPQGVLEVEPLPQYKAEDKATPSQPAIRKEEEIVKVFDSKDEFEVINQPKSPEVPSSNFSNLLLARVSHT